MTTKKVTPVSTRIGPRPAETVGSVGGVAGIAVGLATGDIVTVAVACAAFLPAVVTFWVANGGLDGIKQKFLHGNSK